MKYFYHSSIRNYTIALTDMFSDIHVPRYNEDERVDDFKVPIVFGNRENAYKLNKIDIENMHSGNLNFLPRMVIKFDSMARALERDTNKNIKINRAKNLDSNDKLLYNYQYNPVAYDFYYTIYIATRTFTDATIIVEQIAPMFRTDISIKIQELDIQTEPTTIPVELQDFSFNIPEDLEEDEIRIIEVEFPLILKGNLYLPIKEQGIIETLEINTHLIETDRLNKSKELGLENEEVEYLSSISVTSVEEDNIPNDVDEFEDSRETATTEITIV